MFKGEIKNIFLKKESNTKKNLIRIIKTKVDIKTRLKKIM
jgi:hypothetical protein